MTDRQVTTRTTAGLYSVCHEEWFYEMVLLINLSRIGSLPLAVIVHLIYTSALVCYLACRQAEYANWYPQEVTFQPKLVENTLRTKLQSRAAHRNGLQSTGGGELPLVDRLYKSYEKVCKMMLKWSYSISSQGFLSYK